jgi:hypothetical protein
LLFWSVTDVRRPRLSYPKLTELPSGYVMRDAGVRASHLSNITKGGAAYSVVTHAGANLGQPPGPS